MNSKEEIGLLKMKLARKEGEIHTLKTEVDGLKKKTRLQEAVLETTQEVNAILSADEQGKRLLWTTYFPHNMKLEMAEKIRLALKKTPKSGDGNNSSEK